MTLQCRSCGAKLRVPPQFLDGKTSSAKCPRCKNQIPITAANSTASAVAERSTIRVECTSCGVKLKAPAQETETTSRCPKCKGTITIPAAGTPAPPAPARSEPDRSPMAARGTVETSSEESGVATRRIDSRTLGMMGMGTPGSSGEMDLDDLVRKSPPPAREARPGGAGVGEGSSDIAKALMNPPVENLKKAAETIREGSREISTGSSGETPAREIPPSSMKPEEMKPAVASHRTQAPVTPRPRSAPGRRYPVLRGLFVGGLSGAILGAAWMGVGMSSIQASIESYMAPLPPLVPESLALSAPVVRLALLAVLGAIVGFLSGAIGASGDTRALSAVRCGLVGALAGAALGMSGGIDPTSGFRIWPMAHWVRDLMLVGLLTPALNRVIPGH